MLNRITDNKSLIFSIRFPTVKALAVRVLHYNSYDYTILSEFELYNDNVLCSNNGSLPAVDATDNVHLGGYPAGLAINNVVGYFNSYWSPSTSCSEESPVIVMLKFNTVATLINKCRFICLNEQGHNGALKDFEIQFTDDPTATVNDAKDSDKWSALELINGNVDGTEKALTNSNEDCTFTNGLSGTTFTPSSNLTATAGDSNVILSWTAVTGATAYTVKRSTTADGPYMTLAVDIFDTSYVDNTVTNGTIYYYVCSVDESSNSNTASAKPMPQSTPTGNELLRVNMIDSSEREYRLSTAEVDGFINWYTRTIGTGISCYALNDIVDNSKEYLAFEKIISFKVIPLAK